MVVGDQHDAPAALPPENRYSIQEVGWASEPGWTGTKNLVPTGVQSLAPSTP